MFFRQGMWIPGTRALDEGRNVGFFGGKQEWSVPVRNERSTAYNKRVASLDPLAPLHPSGFTTLATPHCGLLVSAGEQINST